MISRKLGSYGLSRLAQSAVILSFATVFAGCSTFSGVDEVTQEVGPAADGIVILKDRKNDIDDETDAEKKRQMRNDLQDQILRLSQTACNDYLRKITQVDTGRKLFFNSISMIAGGVAPLFSSGATEALAVTSGLATGANAEITQTVFQQTALILVEGAIIKSREARLDEIKQLQSKPMKDYGVEAALRDASDFHHLCALRRGFEELQKKNQLTIPSKQRLESELTTVKSERANARAMLLKGENGDGVALTSAQKNELDAEAKRLEIREEEIKSLLPYAR